MKWVWICGEVCRYMEGMAKDAVCLLIDQEST